MPIEYIKRIHERAKKRGAQLLQFSENETAPLTPLAKPLSDCRVALDLPPVFVPQAMLVFPPL
jgi:hypothetical protein